MCFYPLFVKQESKQQCQTPPEKSPNEKGVPHRKRRPLLVPPSPRPISTLENKAWRLSFLAPDEKDKEIPERRRRRKRPKSLYKCFSFDDVWMERNQKRNLEKERQPERGIQLQHLPEDQLKVRNRTLSSSGTVFLSLLWLHLSTVIIFLSFYFVWYQFSLLLFASVSLRRLII